MLVQPSLSPFFRFSPDLLRATYKALDIAFSVECHVAAKEYGPRCERHRNRKIISLLGDKRFAHGRPRYERRPYCVGHKGGADGGLKVIMVKRRPNRDDA
jgi:hypothetical protein